MDKIKEWSEPGKALLKSITEINPLTTEILEWVGTEKFTFDGVSVWKRELYSGLGFEPKYQNFTTKQLIEQYFKEKT